MTTVWGFVMVGEFIVRGVFVLTLPVIQVLAFSSLFMMSVGIGLGIWNVACLWNACLLEAPSPGGRPDPFALTTRNLARVLATAAVRSGDD